jgi:type II secretory pathway component PulF
VICPACGHDQPEATDCARCGVVVARFKPRPVRPLPTPGPAPTPPLPPRAPIPPVPVLQRQTLRSQRPPSLQKRAQFFQQLGRLTGAGVPLDEALATVLPLAGTGALRTAIVEMRKDLLGDRTLPQAMARHPQVFDEVEVALVEAATHTGELVHACDHLHARLLAVADVRSSVLSALAYPLFVLASSFVLMPLPLLFTAGLTAFLVACLGRLLVMLAVLAGLSLLGPIVLAKPQVRARLLALASAVPLVSSAMTHRRLALTLDVLARAVRAGLKLPLALDLAGRASGEPVVARAVQQASEALRSGQPLSQALGVLKGVDAEGLALIAAGEKSGHLAESLQEQADAWLKVWRRDVKLGGQIVRWGLTLLVLASVAFGIADQFRQVLTGDALGLDDSPEGRELRKELDKAMKSMPKDGLPLE